MVRFFEIDATETQKKIIQLGCCPYCGTKDAFPDWENGDYGRDLQSACKNCGEEVLECYEVTGYLLKGKDREERKK